MNAEQIWDEVCATAIQKLLRPHLEVQAIKAFAKLDPRFVQLLEAIPQDYTVGDLLTIIRAKPCSLEKSQ